MSGAILRRRDWTAWTLSWEQYSAAVDSSRLQANCGSVGVTAKYLLNLWVRQRAHTGLEDVRVLDWRHGFASQALPLGDG